MSTISQCCCKQTSKSKLIEIEVRIIVTLGEYVKSLKEGEASGLPVMLCVLIWMLMAHTCSLSEIQLTHMICILC